MKNVGTALVALGIFALGATSQASASQNPRFVGIDTSITQHGFATVTYKGQTYHLTEGDKLAGVEVILIDATDHEVIVKQHHKLKEYTFTK